MSELICPLLAWTSQVSFLFAFYMLLVTTLGEAQPRNDG